MRGGGVRISRGRRWIAFLALPAFGALSIATAVSIASTSPSCEPFAAAIVESQEFTPYEDRLSHLPDQVINPSGQGPVSIPPDGGIASIDGLPLWGVIVSSNGALYQYFLGGDIATSLTVPEFFAAGGIELDRDPTDPENAGENFTEYVLSISERAVEVEIGTHTAALVWADPESNGIRTHHLYWTDGAYNYSLIADRSAERLVTLGRELVC
jgi:hypothetical protein